MSTLAERLAPHLAGTLIHPGNDTTEPFPLAPLPVFQRQSMLPPGMAEEEAKTAGLPHPDFALLWLEAVITLIENEGHVTLVPNDELADLKAAAGVKERRRNEVITFHTPSGKEVRGMARGFDTGHVNIPFEVHDA